MGEKAAGTFPITPVSGVGDGAYYSESTKGRRREVLTKTADFVWLVTL